MKKKLMFLTIKIIMIVFIVNCFQTVAKDDPVKDPFAGILYRDMAAVTGGTYTQTDGTSSFSHTISNFRIAKYEVTYELWYKVHQWATAHGYNFANSGAEGSSFVTGSVPTTAKYEPASTVKLTLNLHTNS